MTGYACLFLCQEVVSAVAKAGGIQHLISMATSEHVIMQNEALIALAIASAIDIGKAISVILCKFKHCGPDIIKHVRIIPLKIESN